MTYTKGGAAMGLDSEPHRLISVAPQRVCPIGDTHVGCHTTSILHHHEVEPHWADSSHHGLSSEPHRLLHCASPKGRCLIGAPMYCRCHATGISGLLPMIMFVPHRHSKATYAFHVGSGPRLCPYGPTGLPDDPSVVAPRSDPTIISIVLSLGK